MNILLVYPQYPDTFWSFKHVLHFISKKAAFPPLGLLTVAAMLPKKWKKKLVDTNVSELTDKHIAWADMIFIGAMIVQKKSAQEIITRCKKFGKIIVAGGPIFVSEYRKFKGVDHFVLNEAETTLPRFLKDLRNGKTKHVYKSTIRPDISKTPIPLWSLIDTKDYASLALQYSRGCPFNCEFCDIVFLNGRIPRTKTPQQIMSELQSLYDFGWRGSVFIVDDNFIGNQRNVKIMLPFLIEWQKKHNYPFKFLTEASTNLASNSELMTMMRMANFNKVFLGIETPNVESLKECGKLQNVVRDLSAAIKTIHKNGMQVMGGFIVGFDNDSKDVFETQIKFIQQTGVVTAMVGMLNAIPQTRLWHRLKKEGRLISDVTGENTDGSVNFVPKMGKETLIEGYKKIIDFIYSPKHYYERVNTLLKDCQPQTKGKLSPTDIKAFVRSLWKIGVLSQARLSYWWLLIKTCFTRIKSLPIAVELAIYGLHYEKIAKKIVKNSSVC